MGVKLQKPGDPGHPGGNRRIYVRVNYGGDRKTRVFTTQKAAEAYQSTVESILRDAELGKVDTKSIFATRPPVSPKTPVVTFAQAAERWWAHASPKMKAGTQDTYRNVLGKHILPVFGPRPLEDITIDDVEAWWDTLRSSGLSHKRLSTIRGILAGVFQQAVARRLTTQDPTAVIAGRMGREDREVRQAEWLTEAELTKLLAMAEAREPKYHPFFLTLASTGIRLGEALGLQVGDVDLARGTLSIRRAVRKHRVGSPKSGKPRTVSIPRHTGAVLRDWMDTIRAEAAVRGQEATWLFPGATGQPIEDKCPLPALRRLLKLAGITRKVRNHDLRHTYASLALQRGVPLLVVSRQLGHSTIAITADIYGHLVPDATREAADAWEAILDANSRTPRATPAPGTARTPRNSA